MKIAGRLAFLSVVSSAALWLAACGDSEHAKNLSLHADPATGIAQATGLNELRPPLGPFSPRIDEQIEITQASEGDGLDLAGAINNAPLSAISSLRIIALNQTISHPTEAQGVIAPCPANPEGLCFNIDKVEVAKDHSNIIYITLFQEGNQIDQVAIKIDYLAPKTATP